MADAFAEQYPLHTMLKAREGERAVVQAFIDWLDEHELTLCEYRPEGYHGDKTGTADGYYMPDRRGKAALIGAYFDVDLNAFEAEKRAMLEALYPA